MKKISDYEKEGFEGLDCNLETSLFEYGLMWKEDKDEIRFVYGIKNSEKGFELFDHSTISKNINPRTEWNWVDWDAIEKFTNTKLEDYGLLVHLVSDLLAYYGYEEIFGSCYWPLNIENDYNKD